MFRRDLKPCLPEVAYVAKCTDLLNDAGDFEYGTPKRISVHVETDVSFIENTDGTERQTEHVLISTDSIGDQDRVWLPGLDHTDESLARIPRRVQRYVDFEDRELAHYEVVL